MAIAYKSQGAGAETATSGAGLSPACPATVDANDILLAHVCYRDTTTTPSTPANWALLAGPQSAGSTPTGRHWIFGKIAAGNEDGTTIAFGTAGGTVVRHARIYSFSGWTSGTITDVVTGFAHGAGTATGVNDTGVTTQVADALAVQAVYITDDNAMGAFTGMSGGTWAEAVAEFTTNLGSDGCMQLQTASMASPGTINGGSFTMGASDPWGVYGFAIYPAPPNRTAPTFGSAVGTAGPGTTTALTTGSFTPAANSILIAITAGDSGGSSSNNATISDSLSGAWTQITLRNNDIDKGNEEGYWQAWYQIVGASPSARTVTFTDAAAAGLVHGGWVYNPSDVDLDSPIGASGFSAGTGADPRTASLVTQFKQSLVFGGMSNWNTCTFSDGNGTTDILDQFGQSGASGCSAKADAATANSGTTVTLSFNRPTGTIAEHHVAAIELKGVIVTQTDHAQTVNDDADLTDTAAQVAAYSPTVTDPEGLTDAVSGALERPLTDPAGLTDTAAQAAGYSPTATDAQGLTDAAGQVAAFTQDLTDAGGLTDTAGQAAAFTQALTDPAGLTDAATALITIEVVVTDPAGLTDSTAQVAGYAPAPTDPVGLTDTAGQVAAFTQALTDPEGLLDAAGQQAAVSQTLTDPAGLTDAAGQVAGYDRTVTDLLDGTDAGMATTVGETISDPAGLTDTAGQVAGYDRTVTDLQGLTDPVDQALTGDGAHARTITDQAGLTDTAAQQASFTQALTDQAGLTDTAGQALTAGQTATDPEGLADAAAAVQDAARPLVDPAGLTDTVSSATAYEITVTDLAGLIDAVEQVFDTARTVTDLAGLTDLAQPAAGYAPTVTDQLGLLDSFEEGDRGPRRVGTATVAGARTATATVAGARAATVVVTGRREGEPS